MRALQLILVLSVVCFLEQVASHVALMEPPARNVLWRAGFPQLPKHEDDDYLLCFENGKKCPPCGDSADTPKPLPHQAGGEWALGIIARNYTEGETIDVAVSVTNSHGGFLELKLCPNDDVKKAVKQSCLDRYPLEVVGYPDGKIPITAPYQSTQEINVKVVLPKGVTCDQCVMQMSQYAEQFKPKTGMFRNCADIGILSAKSSRGSSSSAASSSLSSSSKSKSSGRFAHEADPSASVFGTLSSGQRSSKSSRQTVFLGSVSSFDSLSNAQRGPSPFTQFTSKRSPSFSQVQTPFQQQIISSAPFTSDFSQHQQQKPSQSFGSFDSSRSAPRFSSNDFQHQQFQQQQQQQQQRFPSQQPQPILQSFQSNFNSQQPSSSFPANPQFQNSPSQFQNVAQQPTPVAFSPSQVALNTQDFKTHQIASFSSPEPFSSSIQFGSQFSGQQPNSFQRNGDTGAAPLENRRFSGFGNSGSESAFQSLKSTHVNQPQKHGQFGFPRNLK